MPRLAAFRLGHFLPALLLLGGGLLAATLPTLTDFFTSLFNVLPTSLLLLGGTFCVVYGRQRELFMLLVLYLGYFLLDEQADYYLEFGVVREDAALVFHLCSLLLPALYGLFALWQERTHLIQDLVARAAVLLAVVGVAAALARRYPQELEQWLSVIRWPSLHAEWMSLVQFAYPLFLLVMLALLVQYLRTPRPVHGVQFVGALALLWMLPNTFIHPHALQVMSSVVMLMIVVGVAHEAYQMAFRDELTGLPGRRALNERLQRLGRNYVIAMADVDHFKRFNDTHGHDVGDQVLRLVASQLRKVGGGGKVYRYGGEEFTLVFAGKTVDQCLPHLEAVRQAVERYQIQLRDRQQRPSDDKQGRQRRSGSGASQVSVTVSIGVAQRGEEQRSAEDVLKAADKALYGAKSAGRNCVSTQVQRRRGAVKLKTEQA
ncbi:GGDEF domain-containing protein [Phytopseudomonas punonensis]|uniref:diguanylate cyclase n=1 Tax=Phytopseudomonas punonensis TaxID=1220495 RepID=A0A1M6YKH7_9GAMM|nr:GGDEF domain-containing protein [Pseudomonas punonensis]SHL18582.1 diguanylate cyclase (GGDEF) domain-containing protein [Pseudomonas punonensis]